MKNRLNCKKLSMLSFGIAVSANSASTCFIHQRKNQRIRTIKEKVSKISR